MRTKGSIDRRQLADYTDAEVFSLRRAAKAAGHLTYFTGEACKNGHVADRVVHNAQCLKCTFVSQTRPYQIARQTVYQRRWLAKQSHRRQEINLQYNYGIKLSQIRPKPNCCELCGLEKSKIVVDHCHDTMTFRGWLCHRCNMALGFANDDVAMLGKMIEWLQNQGPLEVSVMTTHGSP